MAEIFTNYQTYVYVLLVVIGVLVMRVITNKVFTLIVGRYHAKNLVEESKVILFLKRFLNLLWIVLAVIGSLAIVMQGDAKAKAKNDLQVVLNIGIIAVITIAVASLTNIWFLRTINNKSNDNKDVTSLKFTRYIIVYSIYVIGFLIGMTAIPSMRTVAHTALGGAGVIAVVAGIASQEALANVVSGVFIIIFRPFKIGDTIKVADGMVGSVIEITLRHTIIKNFENKMIIIPNAIINKERVINFDLLDEKCCERIEIGISYDSDIDLAKKIMQEECEKHPLIYDNRSPEEIEKGYPIVKTAVTNLGDSAITIRAWAWAKNYDDSYRLLFDIYEIVKKRFDREGIEIPFPHRTIMMKHP